MSARELANAIDAGTDTPETRQWCECMALIATGMLVKRARRFVGFSPALFRRYLHAEGRLRKRYSHAMKWGRRRRYGKAAIEAALTEVATTQSSFRAALFARGFTQAQYIKISRWTQTDPWLREAYRAAKEAQRTRLVVGVLDRFWSDEAAGTKSGRRRINQAWHAIRKLRPAGVRRRAAAERREGQAAVDPVRGTLAAARRRAKQSRRPA